MNKTLEQIIEEMEYEYEVDIESVSVTPKNELLFTTHNGDIITYDGINSKIWWITWELEETPCWECKDDLFYEVIKEKDLTLLLTFFREDESLQGLYYMFIPFIGFRLINDLSNIVRYYSIEKKDWIEYTLK